MTDERTRALIDECKRQEESCLHTSTSFYEWVKSLRLWRVVFVIVPIVLGVMVPFLKKESVSTDWQPLVGAAATICAILAGLATAIYKALDLDVNLDTVTKHAQQFKVLQDRFRQTWRVTALGPLEDFKKEFDDLMARMDAARGTAPTAPERFFGIAQKKIKVGHYTFASDRTEKVKRAPPPQ
jgi:hypothetical protein